MPSAQCAGVDTRAATDIEDAAITVHIYCTHECLAEIQTAAIHGGGEAPGARRIGHGSMPVASVLRSAPVRRPAGAQHAREVLDERPLTQRGVVRRQVPG